jgi:peptidoglycan/LPS O-acetylase OafA/YrhL
MVDAERAPVPGVRDDAWHVAEVTAGWQHLPALDGLRAAAVMAVLAFHAGFLQGGFLGVDLFFVLSGFLITSLLIRDADSAEGARTRLVRFWGRRFRRLLPAVFVMIALVAGWAALFGSGADLAGVRNDGPWAVAYLANWHFIAGADGYWQSFAQPSMFDHLWSLAIEEQFYLLWPIVLVAIWTWSKRPQRTLVIASATGIALSLVAMIGLYDGVEPTRVYMGTDTRAASLLVGALAATAGARRLARLAVTRLGRWAQVVTVVLLCVIVWSWVAVDGASSAVLYRGGLLVHSVGCALVIALVVVLERAPAVRWLAWRPLARIGTLSYGLYLWHWPIYVVLSPERTGLDGWQLAAVRVASSFAAAAISFLLVEDPIRRRAVWARGRSGVIALVMAAGALLILLVSLPEPAVEIATFEADSIAVAVASAASNVEPSSSAAPDTLRADVAAPAGQNLDVRDTSVRDASIADTSAAQVVLPTVSSVVWAGDSVAFDLAPAVIASLRSAGLAVDDLEAYPGFRLVTDRDDIDLSRLVPERAGEVGADLALVQISNWDTDVDSDTYALAVTDLAEALDRLDGRLVMVATPPTANADVNAELDRLFSVVAGLARTGELDNLSVLDSRAWWGQPGAVDLDGDGSPERKRDLTHVCPAGGARFGALLADDLAEHFAGVEPGDPAEWADALWVFDERFDDPVGACAPLD